MKHIKKNTKIYSKRIKPQTSISYQTMTKSSRQDPITIECGKFENTSDIVNVSREEPNRKICKQKSRKTEAIRPISHVRVLLRFILSHRGRVGKM